MADGNDPGPKGFRLHILDLWSRSAKPGNESSSSPVKKPRKPPEPRPHPRGMARWKAPAFPVQPAMSEKAKLAEHRRSYLETLKERVREGQADSESLIRRDFDRERA